MYRYEKQTSIGALKPSGRQAEVVHSPAYEAYLKQQRKYRMRLRVAQVLVLAAVLCLWELSARLEWANPMLTSSPSMIAASMGPYFDQSHLLGNTLITFVETVIGFAVSMLVGSLVAIALWWSKFFSEVLEPYLVVLNAIPKVALGPIFYIWLGDKLSIYGMAVAISVIVTIITLLSGFIHVDKNRLRLMESFGATRWQTLRIVVLPANVPTFISAMKVNVGLTLVGVIMGEFLSAKAGLGFLITYGGQVFQMNLVMTSVVMLAVLSLLLYGGVSLFGNWLSRVYHFD
ncbi:MAG: ABC transporter permease [Alicyclobacillus sp.]|nr:ABC transporter permease [Alicyclobacillus sp.]